LKGTHKETSGEVRCDYLNFNTSHESRACSAGWGDINSVESIIYSNDQAALGIRKKNHSELIEFITSIFVDENELVNSKGLRKRMGNWIIEE
jgi:hypothetical protein